MGHPPYDHNGNTTTKTDSSGTTTYNWDSDNELTSVVLPASGGTVSFKYDPFGRRIQKSSGSGTANYLYNGPSLIAEVNSSGSVTASYIGGPNVDEPLSELRSGTISYYEQDGLGSVGSLSNSAGALANTYIYDSFGKVLSATGSIVNPLQYTAREYDNETGMYYYRARYFDANVGHFIQEDPIRFNAGINFYVYVRNRPLQYRDPTGRQDEVPSCRVGIDCVHSPEEQAAMQRQHDQIMYNIFHPDPTPPFPVPDPIPNAIASALNAFRNCANHLPSKPCVPETTHAEPPREGSGETPGPADYGVTSDEGSLPDLGNPSDTIDNLCDCLKLHPLAALSKLYTSSMGPAPHTCFIPLF